MLEPSVASVLLYVRYATCISSNNPKNVEQLSFTDVGRAKAYLFSILSPRDPGKGSIASAGICILLSENERNQAIAWGV